ncbi:hypothetical protein CHS0354_004685 [Potamilus streckersoni]|uniref:Ubiquitin n=1 Tax=Potamilus streckersoni TaxID=2493646 RepID=A0AAE0RUI7_9BIVA|nr:hypothetical protein CHS0354_004685 [Potamilus streckersoni]
MEEAKPICSICLETFKDPRTISCNHVFCSGCLKKHEEKNAREGRFACPLCNSTVTVSLKGVMVEATNQRDVSKEVPVQCDVCGPKISATSKCIECEQNYCQVCSAMHLKIKALRNHTLREFGAVDQEEKVTLYQRDFCPKHPEEEIKIVCKSCNNIPLCLFCKISEHDSHKSRMLAEEVEEVKSILQNNSTLCAVKLENLQSHRKEGDVLDSVIDKSEQDETMTVNKQEQELIRLLEEHKQKVKNEAQNFRERIERVYKKVRKENEDFKKMIEKEYSRCVALQSEARTLIETAKDSEIVKIGYNLSKKLLEESKRAVQVKMLNVRRRAFIPAGLSMQKLEFKMGDISNDITSSERRNTIQLYLMFLTGQTTLLEVSNSPSQTIREIKQRIQETQGIPVDHVILRLPFLGKELQDNQSLCNYYIHDGSTIEVLYKRAPVQEEDTVIKI